jgi:hypothetical protein
MIGVANGPSPVILVGPDRRQSINLLALVESIWTDDGLALVMATPAFKVKEGPHIILIEDEQDAARVFERIRELAGEPATASAG